MGVSVGMGVLVGVGEGPGVGVSVGIGVAVGGGGVLVGAGVAVGGRNRDRGGSGVGSEDSYGDGEDAAEEDAKDGDDDEFAGEGFGPGCFDGLHDVPLLFLILTAVVFEGTVRT